MGAADGRVVIDTQLNNAGFVKGVKGLKGELGGLQTVVRRLGGLIASAFAVDALLRFSKACVELGSNVAEVQNVVDVAFGDMTDRVEEFANSAIQNFGMSRLAAKKTASTYMAMGKGMGVANDAAADMAITLAGLTGDVASFFNISQELADVKLKSVYTGETETLKDLGVVMTQDNLKAYALTQGITKSYEAMSQAEKVALRYNFVLDSLALAQGDFVRTQDSWANQTRILSMQWQEFMAIVGQTLITVLTPTLQVLNDIVSSLISVASTVNAVVAQLFGKEAQQAASTAASIESSVDSQNALTDAVEDTAKAQQKALAGFDEVNQLSADTAGNAGSSADISAGTVAGGAGSITTPAIDEGIIDSLEKILYLVGLIGIGFAAWKISGLTGIGWLPTFIGLLTFAAGAIHFIDGAMDAWINGVDMTNINKMLGGTLFMVIGLGLAFGTVGAAIGFLVGGIAMLAIGFRDVMQNGTSFENTLLNIAGLIAGGLGLSMLIGSFVPLIIAAIASVVLALANATGNGERLIQGVWVFCEGFLKFMKGVFSGDLEMVFEGVTAMFNGLKMSVGAIVDTLKDIILSLLDWLDSVTGGKFRNIIENTKQWVSEGFETIKGIFVKLLNDLKKIFNGIIDFFVGVFTLDWTKAWNGIVDVCFGLVNGIISLIEGFLNLIIDAFNFFIRGINNKLKFDAPDWVPVIGGKSFSITVPELSSLTIPRLASGAVIPPNSEFLAVLGDQRNGRNLEAPEGLIRQIVREEAGGSDMNTALLQAILEAIREGKILMVDKKTLGKVVQSSLSNAARASGAAVVPV